MITRTGCAIQNDTDMSFVVSWQDAATQANKLVAVAPKSHVPLTCATAPNMALPLHVLVGPLHTLSVSLHSLEPASISGRASLEVPPHTPLVHLTGTRLGLQRTAQTMHFFDTSNTTPTNTWWSPESTAASANPHTPIVLSTRLQWGFVLLALVIVLACACIALATLLYRKRR